MSTGTADRTDSKCCQFLVHLALLLRLVKCKVRLLFVTSLAEPDSHTKSAGESLALAWNPGFPFPDFDFFSEAVRQNPERKLGLDPRPSLAPRD